MKKKILAWLLCAVMVAVMLPAPMASAADFYEDVESFVLTDEGDSTLIESLVAAGCDNLYEALVYVRNNMDAGAPAELTGRLDNLITDLDSLGGSGEVFTGSLTNFTGGNSPVGINADGTFTRADFSVYDYHGHAGFSAYDGNVMYTYPLDYAQNGIYIGSNIIDMGGGLTKEVNYKAFGIAWEEAEPTSFVLSNEEGGLIDQLIADGYGNSNLYEALVALEPASGEVISEDFLDALAGCSPDSGVFTQKLNDYAGLNGGIAVNTDGTAFITTGIKGRDYHGHTGYSTYPASAGARESFTCADSAAYYIDAERGGTSYKVFAIGWSAASVPTVVTGEILDLTASGALIWGEVTDDGGDNVTERGIVYALSPDPTTATGTTVQAAAAGAGAFSAVLAGLAPGTAYYVRAYALNAAGTSYGACRHFTTPVSVTTLAVGSMPQQAAVNRVTNKIYVPNSFGNSVTVIDGTADTVLTTVSLGSGTGACHAAVNETTNKIYVIGNSVSVINGATDTVEATIPVGSGPRMAVVNESTNMIYVANYGSSTVTAINGADNSTATLALGGGLRPRWLAVNKTTNKLYTANYGNDTISVIDCSSGALDALIPAQNSVRYIAVNEATNTIYAANYRASSMTVVNGADNTYRNITVGTDPWEIAVNENTNQIYVSTDGLDTVAIVDGATDAVTTAPAGSAPQAIALNPYTNSIFVGNYSEDDRSAAGYTVSWIDGSTLETVGLAGVSNPSFITVNNQTNKVYVVNFNNTVTIIALTPSVPAPDYVCEIVGGAQYETLDAAVSAVPADTPTTIRLLRSIDRSSTLALDGSKKITLDLNGYNLNVNAMSGAALELSQGSSLITTGSGALNAMGSEYGIHATQSSTVNTTGDVKAGSSGTGVYVYGSGVSVTAVGNISGHIGIQSANAGSVAVTGTVTGGVEAVIASESSHVLVTGVVTGTTIGVRAYTNAVVTVTGSVQATGPSSNGIMISNGAEVTVSGNVQGDYSGVTAWSGKVSVGGDVVSTAAAGMGVSASDGAEVFVTGSTVSTGQWGIKAANGSSVSVDGDVQGNHYGILVSTGAEVFVGGNVRAVTSDGAGVNANQAGKATIDGTILAYKAMCFGESNGDQVIPTTKPGYLTYSDNAEYPSFIWIKSAAGTLPSVTTDTVNASGVTLSSADVSGSVTSAGTAAVTERGFVYGTSANPTTLDTKVTVALGTGTGAFSATLTGLSANTTYHVRAYAISAAGTAYGADRTFTTLTGSGGTDDDPPAVVTNTVTDITASGATLNGNVTSDGGATVTARGFVYGATANPAIGGAGVTQAASGSGTGAFTANISGLTAGSTYHVRAYATNSEGTSYGTDVTFTTLTGGGPGPGPEDNPPTVVTNTVTGITASGATLNGNVTASDGATVTARGFVYDATANPAIGGAGVAQAASGSGTGAFTANISGLTAGSTYHVRAYATNSEGTSYGADVTFTTLTGGGGEPDDPYIFRTLTDSATGITVSGVIHRDAALTVKNTVLHAAGTCAACDAIRQRMTNSDFITLIDKDISLSLGFTGSLTVTIPVGSAYNGETVTILHCASGTLKTYTATVKDGKATFTVTSLSPFAVFADADELDNIPKTGDGGGFPLWLGLMASGVLLGSVLVLRRRPKRA